jgi:predicted metalloprotease with PDZ domain
MPVAAMICCTLVSILMTACAARGTVGAQDAGAAAAAPSGAAYTVSLREARMQMIDVAIRVEDVAEASIEFVLPAWRPGRYAILDPAGGVREVRARGEEGRALVVSKVDKSTWRVQAEGSRVVTMEYRVYANALGDRTRHADDTHAFISPTGVLMFVPDRRALPVTISVEAPEGWRTATGLDSANGLFTAPDYDTLADSPLEVGLHETIDFDVDGTPHQIVLWGRNNHARRDLPGDFSRLIRAQRDIFGRLPHSRYVFIIHCSPGARGATEHLNSTVIQTSPTAFDTGAAYRGFLGTVSHEFFHTWNVKQFRPAGLSPYDYLHENYTPSLWIAEGMTSYYGPLTLARAGLLDLDEFFKGQAEAVGALLDTPGRTIQSLEESSFDAWIKFNRSTPDSVNSTISFYSKGALVSLLLDLELRQRTGGQVSLDHVMRAMYESFPLGGPGYTPEDFQATVERLSESDFDAFFNDFVGGTAELPLADALSTVGLTLALEPDKDAAKDDKPDPAAYIGLNISDRGGLATVDSARSDGPAYAAGVIAGDEVVALNGVRLRAADLGSRLDLLKPGDIVRLTLLRRDELREVEFAAGARPRGTWKLKRVDEPSTDQQAAYESWLGHPWPTSTDASPESVQEPSEPSVP